MFEDFPGLPLLDLTPSKTDLLKVFATLLKTYGPLNWWPADSAYEVAVGAILTQNTAWRNVEKALANLRHAGIWSIQNLHATEKNHLAMLIRPSGYFNIKARKLKEFAGVVVRDYQGDFEILLGLPKEELRAALISIWGIGEETADDIVLYAAKKPSFVIDTYTRRIVKRLGWSVDGNAYEDYKRLFESRLPADTNLFNEYHALLDRHGSITCRPQPLCTNCTLLSLCPTGKRNISHTNPSD